MSDFTRVPITDQFLLPNDEPPGRKSTIEFLLTAEMHNTVTGAVRSPIPILARLDDQGRLSVTLDANDDPTTSPVGTHYRVTYHLEGQSTPARSFEIAVTYLAEVDGLILSLVAPANVAPAVVYGLSNVSVPAPLLVSLVSGVAVVGWDPALGVAGDLPYRTADGVEWQTPTPAAHSHAEADVTSLSTDLTNLSTSISNEASTRAGADTTLAGDLADEATARADADSAEATTRANDDSAEATARALADSTHARLTTAAHGGLVSAIKSASFVCAEIPDAIYFLDLDAAGRNITATLPAPVLGRRVVLAVISNTDGWDASIVPPAGVMISGQEQLDAYLLYTVYTLWGNGTQWTQAGLVLHSGNSGLGSAGVSAIRVDGWLSNIGGEAVLQAIPPDSTAPPLPDVSGGSYGERPPQAWSTWDHQHQLSLAYAYAGHTHAHADTTLQTANDHHNKSHVHLSDGSGTVDYSSLANRPTLVALGSASPSALGIVAVGTSTAGSHEDHVHPTTGLALVGSDNAFSVGQGVRAALGAATSGLNVPWISGDTQPTMRVGASTTGNNQTGLQVNSDSGTAISGSSASNTGVVGNSQTSVGVQGIMSGAGAAAVEARYTGSSTSTVQLLLIRNNTAAVGGGTAGTGSQVLILCKSDTTAGRNQAQIVSTWIVATDASRTSRLAFYAADAAGFREGLRIDASGSAPLVGFYGHAAAGQQTVTGSRSGGTALTSLLTALAASGIVVDSSTS